MEHASDGTKKLLEFIDFFLFDIALKLPFATTRRTFTADLHKVVVRFEPLVGFFRFNVQQYRF